MPSGYQNRITPAYWSSSDASWTGIKWTAASLSSCVMVPSSGMLLDRPGITEIRMLIKVSGVKLIWHYDGSTLIEQFMASGLSNEHLILRSQPPTTSFRLDFDTASAIEILEIEAGLFGYH